jgi:magnesium-transporting ATPase (P-type)
MSVNAPPDNVRTAALSLAPGGLTTREATARLAHDGPNRLPVAPPVPRWRRLAAQLVHFFAILLWAAGGLAIVAGMPQLGLAIVAVVIINGLVAFIQEQRAETAAERLRDLLPARTTVVRDGTPRIIDASELVVGDLVLLAAGDRISADMHVAEAHDLRLDTSTLTGESLPESVQRGAAIFAGTYMVEGEGQALVTAIGSATRLAGIAQLTRAGRRPPSPLARELERVVRAIAIIAIGVGGAFFALALALGTPPGDGFLFAIGVTVALVPEGLLPTITLSLALGARRMAARQALVRRLESIETLGSTTVICTDKTGTLTRNEMAVTAAWTPAGQAVIDGNGYEPAGTITAPPAARPALRTLALAAVLCSTGRAVRQGERWVAQGDPMEAALDAFARRCGWESTEEAQAFTITRRFPFTASRRRMSVVAGDRLIVKGAPEAILPLCRDIAQAADMTLALAERGLRVLAVAARPAAALASTSSAAEAETNLELLGLLGLEDPPRPAAAAALAACRSAGIQVAMVTGDHPATAQALAREVGLLGTPAVVVDGSALPADDAALGALVDRDGVVISRVAPEDKLRIARALRQRGHVVAMTGDGVNDGPALQEADIGIAMGRAGTDVAREAADLVLLDDDFATIVAAIKEGRATFANIRRFLTYHLTDNVAELIPFVVWALSGGRIPLALGVLQILALDLGTDQFPALALGGEPPSSDVLRQPPARNLHLFDGALLRRVFLVLGPVEAALEMLAFLAVLMAAGWHRGQPVPQGTGLLAASGAAFAAVIIGQAANAFACRSTTRTPGALGWTSNRLLLGAVAVEITLLLVFLLLPPLARLLGQTPPPLPGWGIALLCAPALLAADALHKRFRQRRTRQ